LNDIGFSVALSQILKAPPYILAIIISLTTSYYADKTRHRTPFIFLHSAIAIVGFVLIAVPVSKEIKLLGIFLAVGGVQPNVPAVLAFAQNNIRSTSKRGVASAMQVAFGAIGGMAASTVFRDQDAPRYLPGSSNLNS
jgi:MFS-type transporter involved in bile tolerance (Atg22 family)